MNNQDKLVPAVFCEEHFVRRALDLLNYYNRLKQIRGESDPLCELILNTVKLNQRLSEVFKEQ